MWLPTDNALETDPEFRPYFLAYAKDEAVFFEDYAAVHKKMSEEGVVCQDTYDFFMDQLDAECGKTAYIFEVAASLPRLHQHVMMLLAHPAQRDDQDSFLEKLEHVPAEGD